jgi:hypothetical protein
MRAIIIEEDRFAELTDMLRAEADKLRARGPQQNSGLTQHQWDLAVDDVFRNQNFYLVRWAQSHGARCVR